MQERTYGIYALEFLGLTSKEVREIGWVHDIKWAFMVGAKPERKFELDHAHVLFGAADSNGLKLEICPRMAGGHLPGVMVPATLQGNLTTVAEGPKTKFTTRVSQEALEQAGLTSAVLFEASCSLECTVSDMPTLEEQTEAQIREELAANRRLEQDHARLMAGMGAQPLLTGTGEGEALPEIADQDPVTETQDVPALDEPMYVDAGPVPPRLTLDPRAPGEDLPFPINDQGGADTHATY